MTRPDELYAAAIAALQAGEYAKAEDACRKILNTASNHVDTLNVLGLAQLRGGKPDRAVVAFKKVLRLNPAMVLVHLNMGLAFAELGQIDDATASFESALQLEPTSIEGHFQLGLLLQKRFKYTEATAHFLRVLEMNEQHAMTHAVLGESLLLQGEFAKARTHLERAVTLNPNLIGALDNLALIALNEGEPDEALNLFAQALSIKSDFAGSHFNRAIARLRQGDLENGLAEFDWRWRTAKTRLSTLIRPFKQPEWQGEALNGRTLLVWGEQGVGDEIRTAGLVDDLLQRGEKISLECDKRLAPLFARSFPAAAIIPRRDPPAKETAAPEIAYQIPAESVIRYTRSKLDAFPRRAAYLKADATRTAEYRARFQANSRKPLVGISWGSYNPQLVAGKSTPLSSWAPILETAGAQIVALQYGDIRTEMAEVEKELGQALEQLGGLDLVKDLDGVASLISACDLVITVSNTTAHLAGALGVPAWVLLPFGHFQPWYWFSDHDDSPWYPSVKLYRQKKFGDWETVISRVAEDLNAWLKNQTR
ncbi:MAG: tetratricopeptide repeat protein [Rhodospirillaceae bacterium]|nr:tetratricopeptide repeat protein [Rhodospirillaceae bacterium]